MKSIKYYNKIADYIEIERETDTESSDTFDITVGNKTPNEEPEQTTITLKKHEIKRLVRDLIYIMGN